MTKKHLGAFHVVLILWALFQLSPLVWLFYSSFKPSLEIQTKLFSLPTKWYFENYDFGRFRQQGITLGIYLKNSIVITSSSLILVTVISLLAGYSIAKLRFWGKNLLTIALIGMIGIPIHSFLIPLYFFVIDLGLLAKPLGLILPYVAFRAPFTTLLLQTYFRAFPDEIIEAAKIDGCSHLTTFYRIVMPVSLGGISTVLIFNFLYFWDEFLFALVVMKPNAAKTLPIGLTNFIGRYSTDWGPLLAGLVVATIPTILFYFVFHRNLIRGATIGSIKG